MAAVAAGVAATGTVRGGTAEAPVGGAGVDRPAPGAVGADPAGAVGGRSGRGGAVCGWGALAAGAAAGRPGMPGVAGVLPASGLGPVVVGGSRASVMRDVGWCASVLIPVPLVVPL
ncbi:hypothetical protein ACFC0D_13915 [Streptomyces sp. NPDC056222]|uniref:hypothetical protein n=1 Tax=Streptomyces sp. NPDC056222 TaxID=3345749 RepID=UPI0035E220B0